jgi:hypothetical protein
MAAVARNADHRTEFHRVAVGVDADEFPPAALAVVVASIGRTLVLEQALGTTGGHDEAIALVNRFIDRFEMPQPKPKRGRSARE